VELVLDNGDFLSFCIVVESRTLEPPPTTIRLTRQRYYHCSIDPLKASSLEGLYTARRVVGKGGEGKWRGWALAETISDSQYCLLSSGRQRPYPLIIVNDSQILMIEPKEDIPHSL
jgi:hypothetical protein